MGGVLLLVCAIVGGFIVACKVAGKISREENRFGK